MVSRTKIDNRYGINMDLIIEKVLEELGRPAQFAKVHIHICSDWIITIRRDWVPPGTPVGNTPFSMDLQYTGIQRGSSSVASVNCEDLSSALGAVPRLVEDCKKMVWNEEREYWTYPS